MSEPKLKIYAVCGPTASGKTALAIELAHRLDGEIISCDSMQIYREMNIGTAKPDADELAAARHHLIDIVSPDEDFSTADYTEHAKKAILDITSRRKTVIFCGGTGMYLDNVITANEFSSCASDDSLRAELDRLSSDELHDMLEGFDPQSASAIHKNNRKRVIRAIEIYRITGKTKTEWDAESRKAESPYDARVIMPDWDRELLYGRINRRVDMMIEQGLPEEVRILREKYGDRLSSTAAQAIGYKELFDWLDGKMSMATSVENIKTATRNYAKRQLTWFNHRDYVRTFAAAPDMSVSEMADIALRAFNGDENGR